MKKHFLIAIYGLMVFSALSFRTTTNLDLKQTIKFYENDQIKIESQFVEYKVPKRSVIKNYLLLTIENKTKKNIKVQFERKSYYNDKCFSCNSPESIFVLTLKKKEIKTGNITDNDKSLKVFHSFKTGESDTKLTNLIIDNVIVKNL